MVDTKSIWLKLPKIRDINPDRIQGNNIRLFKEIASKEYNSGNQSLIDKACAQFLKLHPELSNFFNNTEGYDIGYENKFYKDLGSSSWCADIETAMALKPTIKEFIFSYGLVKNCNDFDLFVNSVFSNSAVLYISPNFNKSNIIDLNNLCAFEFGIDVIFIYVDVGSESTISLNNLVDGTSLRRFVGFLGKNAKVKFIHNDNFKDDSKVIQSFNWHLDEDADLCVLHKLSSNNLNVIMQNLNLTGNNSSINYQARLKAKNDNNIVTLFTQTHKGENTKSNVSLKSITADSSKLFSRGIIDIDALAINSQASLELIALSTDSRARNCAIPTLEVKTSKVSCRHASATGSVNGEHLWYLQSRGFDGNLATNIIINGFLSFDFKTHSDVEQVLVEKLKHSLVE